MPLSRLWFGYVAPRPPHALYCIYIQYFGCDKMKRKPLPNLQSPTNRELREMWRRYPDGHEVRRLILEIARCRQRFRDAEDLRKTVQKVWSEDVGGHLVALYQLRLILQDEARFAEG